MGHLQCPAGLCNVSQSANAHSGSYAARGDAIQFYTLAMQPVLQVGPGGHGFAYTGRPASISGYYIFSPQGDDGFAVNVALFKGGLSGTAVASAAALLTSSHATYTKWTVPFNYITSDTPDACYVQFQIVSQSAGGGAVVHVGSYFILDDLTLDASTDVPHESDLPHEYDLRQNYPNPFNPTTTIVYALPKDSDVALTVFDLLGRDVATLVNGRQQAGSKTVRFDGAGLPTGLYVYRLAAGEYSRTRTMMLVK